MKSFIWELVFLSGMSYKTICETLAMIEGLHPRKRAGFLESMYIRMMKPETRDEEPVQSYNALIAALDKYGMINHAAKMRGVKFNIEPSE